MLRIGQPIQKKNSKRWFEIVGYNPTARSYVAKCVPSGRLEQVGFDNITNMVNVNIDISNAPHETIKKIYTVSEQMGIAPETFLSMLMPDIAKASITAAAKAELDKDNQA